MKFYIALTLILVYSCGVGTTGGIRLSGKPIDAKSVEILETAFAEIGKRARCKGYTQKLDVASYKVKIIDGERNHGIAVFRLPCNAYCGTVWDQGGYILAAGQYLADGDVIVLPEGFDKDAAEHEATHRVYLYNDRVQYAATMIHTPNVTFELPLCREK